jgi:signal transduction histidine kinase
MDEKLQRQFDDERLIGRADRMTRQLSDLAGEVDHAARMAVLGGLAELIAHEIRNLMTPVAGLAQMAIADPSDTRLTARALHTALTASLQAGRIAESILELATPPAAPGRGEGESRMFHVEHCGCDVREVIDAALVCFGDSAARAGVRIEVRAVGGIRCSMDAGDLQQVVLNLVQNAVTASPAGGVVRIGGEEADGRARVWVEDEGPGVPVELGERVFEPHVRGRAGPGEGVGGGAGRGLGLSVCKRLVERAGGRIEAGRGSGGGARFVVVV